jgi:hypothetical protein
MHAGRDAAGVEHGVLRVGFLGRRGAVDRRVGHDDEHVAVLHADAARGFHGQPGRASKRSVPWVAAGVGCAAAVDATRHADTETKPGSDESEVGYGSR